MFRSKKYTVSIAIARGVLESVFDECDKYNADETGGKVIGTYRQKGAHSDIEVLGVLGPGPNASRSPTSLFQDGEYQESIFRSIEESHPNIEHLGSWHTHHINGYPTLSGGDKTTYFNTVNHAKHNTDFFYALLVVRRNASGHPRYDIKHYLFRRNDNSVYEIPAAQVRFIDTPMLWPRDGQSATSSSGFLQDPSRQTAPNPERAKDQDFFSEFYPDLKALFSKTIGAPYWKGSMALVDGSHVLIVAMENPGDGEPSYSITASGENPILASVAASYKERRFRSARNAVLHLEKDLNQAIFRAKKG